MTYAHAQKNFGPSGITISIIREDLIGNVPEFCPSVCNYKLYADHHSLYNTLPVQTIYMISAYFDFIKQCNKSMEDWD